MAENWEKHVFHRYFLNMDILLMMNITVMKIARHVAETRLEGKVSPIFAINLSFHFIFCRILNIEIRKITKEED